MGITGRKHPFALPSLSLKPQNPKTSQTHLLCPGTCHPLVQLCGLGLGVARLAQLAHSRAQLLALRANRQVAAVALGDLALKRLCALPPLSSLRKNNALFS